MINEYRLSHDVNEVIGTHRSGAHRGGDIGAERTGSVPAPRPLSRGSDCGIAQSMNVPSAWAAGPRDRWA
jgi:hypothetical protein